MSMPGVLLGLAYPDRVARRRPGSEARYQMSNGRGALFAAAESIAREEFIVAVDLDDREREAQIRLAAPLDKADLLEYFAPDLRRADELAWDERTEAVVARRVIRFDELLVEEKPLNDVPRAASAAAMLEGVRSMGIEVAAVGRRRARLPGALRVRAQARSQGPGRLAGFFAAGAGAGPGLARAVSRGRHAPYAAHARAAARLRCARG